MARRTWTVVIVVAAVVSGNWGGQPFAVPSDHDRLQGVWIIQSVQKDGQTDVSRIGATLTFTGETVEYVRNALVLLDRAEIPQGFG